VYTCVCVACVCVCVVSMCVSVYAVCVCVCVCVSVSVSVNGTNRSVGLLMLIHHGTRVTSATGDRTLFNSLSEVCNCSQQMAHHC